MYKRIMVPVDLTHAGDLTKALRTAADLAGHYGCPVTYVAVTAATPGPVAHNPAEFALLHIVRTDREDNQPSCD